MVGQGAALTVRVDVGGSDAEEIDQLVAGPAADLAGRLLASCQG
jgi:hypothetical protein